MSTSTASLPVDDDQAIRDVVTQAYFHGAFNELDTQAMRQGFHPEFAMLIAKGDSLEPYRLGSWIEAIELRKGAAGFDPHSARRDCEIAAVDVAGGAASVKAIIRKDGAPLYTDFLLLLRFQEGWRIVSKVFQTHS